MNPPTDNSSCDPPCLMPKSFCSDVSSSFVLLRKKLSEDLKKEKKNTTEKICFGKMKKKEHNEKPNKQNDSKKTKQNQDLNVKTQVLRMNGSLCTHCDNTAARIESECSRERNDGSMEM